MTRVDALDVTLFDYVEGQTSAADRKALLALQASLAAACGEFRYLEIGSYLGGSLQVLLRDPRCKQVMSIDPRPALPPDKRDGAWDYGDNSTARMLSLLREVPGVDLDKISTFEVGTEGLSPAELPARPDFCLVDGEHTDEAVAQDARFCFRAMGGMGVVAFHDQLLIRPGIRRFLDEVWSDVSLVATLSLGNPTGGGVLAVELGNRGLLKSPQIEAVINSGWHSSAWRLASRLPYPGLGLGILWGLMPMLDRAAWEARRGISRLRQRGESVPNRRP